jgi:hypothetical protein
MCQAENLKRGTENIYKILAGKPLGILLFRYRGGDHKWKRELGETGCEVGN